MAASRTSSAATCLAARSSGSSTPAKASSCRLPFDRSSFASNGGDADEQGPRTTLQGGPRTSLLEAPLDLEDLLPQGERLRRQRGEDGARLGIARRDQRGTRWSGKTLLRRAQTNARAARTAPRGPSLGRPIGISTPIAAASPSASRNCAKVAARGSRRTDRPRPRQRPNRPCKRLHPPQLSSRGRRRLALRAEGGRICSPALRCDRAEVGERERSQRRAASRFSVTRARYVAPADHLIDVLGFAKRRQRQLETPTGGVAIGVWDRLPGPKPTLSGDQASLDTGCRLRSGASEEDASPKVRIRFVSSTRS